jgi:L-amino acid N-acyltransferase YncA
MQIREAEETDFEDIWPIFHEIVSAGETYAFPQSTSKEEARRLWMQFNIVATSNDGAVRLWSKLGFDTVGRLPKAFNHPSKGYVDALVMYKWLEKT